MGETTAEAQYRSRRNAPPGLETHAHNAQIGGKTATQQGGPAGLGTARGSSDHLRPALRGCRSPLPEGRRPLAETKEEEKDGIETKYHEPDDVAEATEKRTGQTVEGKGQEQRKASAAWADRGFPSRLRHRKRWGFYCR